MLQEDLEIDLGEVPASTVARNRELTDQMRCVRERLAQCTSESRWEQWRAAMEHVCIVYTHTHTHTTNEKRATVSLSLHKRSGALILAPLTRGNHRSFRRLTTEFSAPATMSEMSFARELNKQNPVERARLTPAVGVEKLFGAQVC